MLVKGQLLKDLRKNAAVDDNTGNDNPKPEGTGSDADAPPPPQDTLSAKKTLLQALKTAEEEVLLQSADTVEFGYLFFIQGDGGGTHLVVDESNALHDKITAMVERCKRDKARVDAFLVSALEHALADEEEE
jgi:hypothetical protein